MLIWLELRLHSARQGRGLLYKCFPFSREFWVSSFTTFDLGSLLFCQLTMGLPPAFLRLNFPRQVGPIIKSGRGDKGQGLSSH